MEINEVVFKGSVGGLSILVPVHYSSEELLMAVEHKIHANARFFKGAKLKVTYKGILLSIDEEAKLLVILQSSGAGIESLEKAEEGNAAGLPVKARNNAMQAPLRKFFSRGSDESDCKIIRSTLRGGTRIKYEGSVVVIGDVNPGAEIIASGSVIVLGLLRGMVHAGADGSKDAFIAALKLKPTQLRIADLIARSPDGEDAPGVFPEIASINEDAIEVNPLYERL